MTTIDYAARLTEVQTAISEILSGQMESYSIEGQTVTKLNIDVLFRWEQRYAALAARAAGTRRAFKQAAPR